jgi:hypothetical protein
MAAGEMGSGRCVCVCVCVVVVGGGGANSTGLALGVQCLYLAHTGSQQLMEGRVCAYMSALAYGSR